MLCKGRDAVGVAVKACVEAGVEYLTLFAFSSENWRRPADEVKLLMALFLRLATCLPVHVYGGYLITSLCSINETS